MKLSHLFFSFSLVFSSLQGWLVYCFKSSLLDIVCFILYAFIFLAGIGIYFQEKKSEKQNPFG